MREPRAKDGIVDRWTNQLRDPLGRVRWHLRQNAVAGVDQRPERLRPEHGAPHEPTMRREEGPLAGTDDRRHRHRAHPGQ
jgi:hypothetical protein